MSVCDEGGRGRCGRQEPCGELTPTRWKSEQNDSGRATEVETGTARVCEWFTALRTKQ